MTAEPVHRRSRPQERLRVVLGVRLNDDRWIAIEAEHALVRSARRLSRTLESMERSQFRFSFESGIAVVAVRPCLSHCAGSPLDCSVRALKGVVAARPI